MLTRSLLALPLLVASQLSWGECECLWEGSFTDVQEKTDLVVAGQIVEAEIASVRAINWDSFQPNFFLVFSPGALPLCMTSSSDSPSGCRHASFLRKPH